MMLQRIEQESDTRSNIGHQRRHPQAGFSLIELLVTLSIVALLVGLVGPRVVGYLGTARADTAEAQVQDLSAALDLFLIDVGRYPNRDEGLQALVENPGALDRWNGPYLKDGEVPADPWGNSYLYERSSDGRTIQVRSLGADGSDGGDGEDADISS